MAADGGASVTAEDGCCFRAGEAGIGAMPCGLPRRAGSAYCPEHHAACHLSGGSPEEHRRLREIEALADVVGGKRGPAAQQPPARLMQRLLRVERRFSRPHRS